MHHAGKPMESDLSGLRVVAVHAHPDDEAITTGGALHHLAARGASVTVVTCTLGEQGEVIGDTYQQLVADKSDQLGGFRIAELRKSLSILGVRGIFLGGAGCWRDSGMIGDSANNHPRAFINSGDSAVQQLKQIFDVLQPHLIITYGPDGGYGHPDHIRAHHITHLAATDQRILWAVTSEKEVKAGVDAIVRLPEGWTKGELACVPDVDFTLALDEASFAAKVNAMRAHASQIWIADGSVSETNPHAVFAQVNDIQAAPVVFALSNLIAAPITKNEYFNVGSGPKFPDNATGLESGLEWK